MVVVTGDDFCPGCCVIVRCTSRMLCVRILPGAVPVPVVGRCVGVAPRVCEAWAAPGLVLLPASCIGVLYAKFWMGIVPVLWPCVWPHKALAHHACTTTLL
jgi:hypothetical protein